MRSYTWIAHRTWAGLLFVLALVALVCHDRRSRKKRKAPGASAPKYDTQTETTVKGQVEELKLPPKASDIAHLTIKSGSDMVDIYLCPKSFLDDMSLTFTKGEELAVTGSKVKVDGADTVLAREVTKGNDTVNLRDSKGVPVWNWQKK